MADINTGNSNDGFVFGQNMEERVLKPPDSDEPDENPNSGDGNSNSCDSNSKNNEESPNNHNDRPLLRPSVFSPKNKAPASGLVGNAAITNNPFAARVSQPGYSDSDDEKRDKPIVAPSHFNPGGAFGSRAFGMGSNHSTAPAKFLLRPSALDKQTAGFTKSTINKENTDITDYKSTFKLEPAKLQNPFFKPDGDASPDKTSRGDSESGAEASDKSEAAAVAFTPVTSPPPLSSPVSQPVTEQPQITNNSQTSDNSENRLAPDSHSSASTGSAGFVFGQDMHDRVTGADNGTVESPPPGNFVFGENISQRVTPPDTKNEAKQPDDNNADSSTEGSDEAKPTSLVESAAAVQAMLAKPEFDVVEVKTGEEDESNVFQLNVKLFLFDKENQSWLEKGRGQLRLNDLSCANSQSFQSRLVMRTQGSLRVVLNTKIWPAMLVEMASEKSVRITAVDQDGTARIYLIMSTRSDSSHIYSAIHSRVQQLKAQEQVSDEGQMPAPSSESVEKTGVSPESDNTKPSKRAADNISPEDQPSKRPKTTRHKSDHPTEESNDSSTVDPETEASNESCASSPTVKSSSSE